MTGTNSNWETLERVELELKNANTIYAAQHMMPDGDCIGSVLALALALRSLGKEVTLSIDDEVSKTYSFLPCVDELTFKAPGSQQLFVYLDGSDRARYGRTFDPAVIGDRMTINIDHHVTNEGFATINLVDVQAASTAEIVCRLIDKLGTPLTQDMAQCILAGIVTDTLGFRTTATTPATLETATRLMRAGGSIPEIIDRVYNRRSLGALKLQGYAIQNARLEGPVIWSQVNREAMKQFSINGSGTGGIVNMLLTVADAKVAFFLVEKEDGKGDLGLRSRSGVDVSAIAYRLGGGGHKQAAGAILPPPFETTAERVLTEIKKELRG